MAWVRRLPFWVKTIVVAALVAFGAVYLYSRFGPIRELRRKNERLEGSLVQAQAETTTLRDRKDELHRENLHLKELIDPIQKKAELLYPELETAAAIAKLAVDLQDVRSLATRDVYKPLSPALKDRMIAALRSLQLQNAGQDLSVGITVQPGSSTRDRVARDLSRYLQDAGWKVELQFALRLYTGTAPDVSIEMHPDDTPLAQQLAGVVGSLFINQQFAGIRRENISRGHLEIAVNGDPLFSETGMVTFR